MKLGIWARSENQLWVAGSIYQQNLIRGLSLISRFDSLSLLLAGATNPAFPDESCFHNLKRITLTRSNSPVSKLARFLARKNLLPNRPVDRLLNKNGIDIVFGNLLAAGKLHTPWVTRITDFQYLHYPENFSEREIEHRTAIARKTIREAARVLVSGPCVLKDLLHLAPDAREKVSIVPFTSTFPDTYYQMSAKSVAAKYHLMRAFVLIPVQWWKHKNHLLVLESARILKARGIDCQWVFTGAIYDHRNPDYYSKILQTIASLGLSSDTVILGFLPRKEQVQLIRAADCVLQPSLFEGFSIAVEDAKTLGQRLVLSDIPAHRERDPRNGLFFDPRSATDLADKLECVLAGQGPSRGDEQDCRREANERLLQFAEQFSTACEAALAAH